MHPLLGLCLVILGIITVVYALSFIKKKQSQTFYGNGEVKIKHSYMIDSQYKIVLLTIRNSEKAFLLGPTSAIEISYERQDNIKSAEIESTGCTDNRD